ncbi:hypothetical protein [Rubrobacter calidifluminis]|uniref:hypothetical protein n=1 Tax=Rubrobacter calidifluminis TaxID=1392640 RepID=UPI00235EAC5D|nr:hypothetical protein [Rubrobacter calidifluminis]
MTAIVLTKDYRFLLVERRFCDEEERNRHYAVEMPRTWNGIVYDIDAYRRLAKSRSLAFVDETTKGNDDHPFSGPYSGEPETFDVGGYRVISILLPWEARVVLRQWERGESPDWDSLTPECVAAGHGREKERMLLRSAWHIDEGGVARERLDIPWPDQEAVRQTEAGRLAVKRLWNSWASAYAGYEESSVPGTPFYE